MPKKLLVLLAILVALLLTGWLVKLYCFPPALPQELPQAGPAPVEPLPGKPAGLQNSMPAALPVQAGDNEEKSLGSQRIANTRPAMAGSNNVNLAEHGMSIKREEKQGYEVLPGVTVKRGAVTITLDQDSKKSLELERSPANAGSQYQMLLKNKF